MLGGSRGGAELAEEMLGGSRGGAEPAEEMLAGVLAEALGRGRIREHHAAVLKVRAFFDYRR
jgi:hypothetical protein